MKGMGLRLADAARLGNFRQDSTAPEGRAPSLDTLEDEMTDKQDAASKPRVDLRDMERAVKAGIVGEDSPFDVGLHLQSRMSVLVEALREGRAVVAELLEGYCSMYCHPNHDRDCTAARDWLSRITDGDADED